MSPRHRYARARGAAGLLGASLLVAGLLVASSSPAQPPPASPGPAGPVVGEPEASTSAAQRGRARSALELSGFVGPSVVFGEPANPDYSPSVERLGALVAGSIAYRSGYFLDPGLEVGYAWLARGSSALPSGPWGEGGKVEQSLGAWLISPGVSAELWRVRARLGLGLGIVTQSDTFRGYTSTTSQLPLMSQLVIACKAVDLAAVQLDVEGRAVVASGADVTFVSLGVSARFDIVRFGAR